MLLYDQLMEHTYRMYNRTGPERFGERNLRVADLLRRAAVYEVSDVVPLLGDWQREKDKAIPKRPPHPVTWVEWKYPDWTEDGKYGDDWTLGALVRGLGEADLAAVLRRVGSLNDDQKKMLTPTMSFEEFMRQDKEFYEVLMFKRLDVRELRPDGGDEVVNTK
jgi:hypothetical protein